MDRTALEERLREIDDLLARLDADEESLRHDRADATADDEHDPEGSTLSGEWQRVDALRRARQEERAEVVRALSLIDSGGYGVCTVCGRDIPAERMEARPTATMCVACASRM